MRFSFYKTVLVAGLTGVDYAEAVLAIESGMMGSPAAFQTAA